MFCNKCGSQHSNRDKFCSKCGTSVSRNVESFAIKSTCNELVGVWTRVTEDGKVAEIYEFTANGTVKLWSWWVGVIEATYKINAKEITLSHDKMGDATTKFKVNGNTLTLTNEDGKVTELTRNDNAWDNFNKSDGDLSDDCASNDGNAADNAVYMNETMKLTLDSLRKAAENEGVKPEKYEGWSFDNLKPVDGFEFEYEYTIGYGGGSLKMTIFEFKNENEVRDCINYLGNFYVYLAAGRFVAVIMGDEVVGMRFAQKIFVNAGADLGDIQIGGSAEINTLKKAVEELGYGVDDNHGSSFMSVKPVDSFCFEYTYTFDRGSGMGDIAFYEFKNEDNAKKYADSLSAGYDYWVFHGKFVAKTNIDHESAQKLINDIFDKARIK